VPVIDPGDDRLIIRGAILLPSHIGHALTPEQGFAPDYRVGVERPATLDEERIEVRTRPDPYPPWASPDPDRRLTREGRWT
jgi:hypothetical protein